MTRYYYTDPLAAAWMAKQYGMQFEPREKSWNKIEHWTSLIAELEDCHSIEEDRARGKYYIHPDSLPLLEPNIGDLVIFLNARTTHIVSDVCSFASGYKTISVQDKDNNFYPEELKIIQRNNIAFIWPEREEV